MRLFGCFKIAALTLNSGSMIIPIKLGLGAVFVTEY